MYFNTMRGFLSINRKFSNILTSYRSTLSLSGVGIRFGFSSAAATQKPATAASVQTQTDEKKTTKTIVIDRLNFSPHEYWVTQGQGMERPFTGDKWFEKDVGYYHCTVCEKRLFTWDQKYQSPTGMATFWHHEKNAVLTSESPVSNIAESKVNLQSNAANASNDVDAGKKAASCSGCHSHLGLVHFDGPPPTFKRFSINSAAIKFLKKEHWENPHFIHKKRKLQKLTHQEEQTRKRAVLSEQKEREANLSSSSSGSSSSSSSSQSE